MNNGCETILEGTIIFSFYADEHIPPVLTVLSLLHKAGVRVNLKKGNFFTERIDYLGQVIQPDELELAYLTADPIQG